MASQASAPAAGSPGCTRLQAVLCGPSVPPSATAPPGAAPTAGPARSTVLVVEDEPLIRLSVCDALEGAGLGVEEAGDADRALGLISALGADRGWCRVLVTDVNLGRGLDGIALAAEARRSVPGLRVLYITGNPERVLAGRPAPPPRDCVLGKPFDTAQLVEAVRRLVESAPPRGA